MSSQRQSQPSQQNVKPTGIHAHPDDFYDPAKSTTSTEALQVWLQSPLSDDLGKLTYHHYRNHYYTCYRPSSRHRKSI